MTDAARLRAIYRSTGHTELAEIADRLEKREAAVRKVAQEIIEKCEQYWNESGIGDAEVHAALGFIRERVADLERAWKEAPEDSALRANQTAAYPNEAMVRCSCGCNPHCGCECHKATKARQAFTKAAEEYAAELIRHHPDLTDDGVSYTGLLAGAYRAMKEAERE